MNFQSLYKVSMINRCSLSCIHDVFGYEIERKLGTKMQLLTIRTLIDRVAFQIKTVDIKLSMF